jgi:hypothetical protein
LANGERPAGNARPATDRPERGSPKETCDKWERDTQRCVASHIPSNKKYGPIKMTNTERSTHPSSPNTYGSSGKAHAADAPKDDLVSTGAAAFREAQANVANVIADAGDKGQQALKYAGQKRQEAMDNVRAAGDTLTVAIERSVTTRLYTTLALAVAAGFLFGATWRRSAGTLKIK